MLSWLQSHKALVGSVVTALVAISGVVPPPYSEYLSAAAVILAALSGGPQPASPAK